MGADVMATTVQETSEAITAIGATERTLFVGVMLAFLIFSGFFMWQSSKSQKEQRDAFLNSMDRRDDKMTQSLDKFSDAINKNTEVLTEVKTRIK